MVYPPLPGLRAKPQNLQSTTQTLVGFKWRLTLKYPVFPFHFSRTRLARDPTVLRSEVR